MPPRSGETAFITTSYIFPILRYLFHCAGGQGILQYKGLCADTGVELYVSCPIYSRSFQSVFSRAPLVYEEP